MEKIMEKYIDIQIPKNFMNCAVTVSNHFIADTNDINNWDTLKFPLPEPKNKWEIYSYFNDTVEQQIKYVKLIDRF